VQRRAAKLVWGVENLHCEERLKRLVIMHLGRRRARSDLLEAFKIIKTYDITLDTCFILDDAERRGHSKTLLKRLRRSRLDIRKYVFLN